MLGFDMTIKSSSDPTKAKPAATFHMPAINLATHGLVNFAPMKPSSNATSGGVDGRNLGAITRVVTNNEAKYTANYLVTSSEYYSDSWVLSFGNLGAAHTKNDGSKGQLAVGFAKATYGSIRTIF